MNLATKSVLITLALGLPGCATVIRGPNVDFQVITDPPGATVKTDVETARSLRAQRRHDNRERLGKLKEGETHVPVYYGCAPTPCSFEISRRAEFTVMVENEGYHDATVQVTSGFGGGAAGSSVAGAAASATGAYVVSYGVVSALSSAVASIVTLGTTTASSTGAASAATVGAASVGVLVLGVDLVSGAMLNLRPNPMALVLIPSDQPLPDAESAYIDNEEKLDEVLLNRAAGGDDPGETS